MGVRLDRSGNADDNEDDAGDADGAHKQGGRRAKSLSNKNEEQRERENENCKFVIKNQTSQLIIVLLVLFRQQQDTATVKVKYRQGVSHQSTDLIDVPEL